MVDALLGVASCVMEDEEELELYVVTYKTTGSSVRRCEFCKSTDTPAWRRGPSGKGSLCNACGIKWRLKKKIKKSDSSPWNDIGKRSHVNMKRTAGRPVKKIPKVIHHFVESRMRCQSCHFPTDPQDFNDPVFDLRCRICVEKSLASENDESRSSPLSDPESPSSPSPEALVARLLNVVAHGLVDVTELSQVNDELQTMKSELLLKQTKDRHEHQLAEFRTKVNQDLADLKSNALHKIREANRVRAEQLRSFFESMVSSLDLALVEQQSPSSLL